jgi:hypothetical protein
MTDIQLADDPTLRAKIPQGQGPTRWTTDEKALLSLKQTLPSAIHLLVTTFGGGAEALNVFSTAHQDPNLELRTKHAGASYRKEKNAKRSKSVSTSSSPAPRNVSTATALYSSSSLFPSASNSPSSSIPSRHQRSYSLGRTGFLSFLFRFL